MASGSSGLLRSAAIGLALIGVLFLIVQAPRLLGLEETSWWVTVAIGLVLGAVVVAVGYAKRGSGETHHGRPDE
jgi:hypothetical protein